MNGRFKRMLAVTFGVLVLTAMAFAMPAVASAAGVLVYTGGAGWDAGYADFATATGLGSPTVATTLPTNLSDYDVIILSMNRSFSSAYLAALNTYVRGGGRLLALGEWEPYSNTVPAMNGLASSLGSGLSLIPAAIDTVLVFPTYPMTTQIDPHPLTSGVTEIGYAGSSQVAVAVSSGAASLVREDAGAETILGAERIGSGWFVLSGDTNIFSDRLRMNGYTPDPYVAYDNGRLARNIALAGTTSVTSTSASGPLSLAVLAAAGCGLVAIGRRKLRTA